MGELVDQRLPGYSYGYVPSVTLSRRHPKLPSVEEPPVMRAVHDLLPTREWFDSHPFFRLAKEHPQALTLWVTQECRVSAPFTRMLVDVASRFAHNDLREQLFLVARGELGSDYEEWIARQPSLTHPQRRVLSTQDIRELVVGPTEHAHARLLDQLRQSMGVSADLVVTFRETRDWLECMRGYCAPTGQALEALAVLGEGNERYILREYLAVERAFKEIAPRSWPGLDYSPFLRANVAEDSEHSRILRTVAAQLIHGTTSSADFDRACDLYYEAARAGIERRNLYYDRLADRTERFITDPDYLSALAHERPEDVAEYREWTTDPTDVVRSIQDFAVRDNGLVMDDYWAAMAARF